MALVSSSLGVLIESLAYRGAGVGHLSDGRAVFVADTAPGDRVTLEIIEEHRRYAVARVAELVSASRQRIEPYCPYHKVCGGCSWQHLAYEEQCTWKQRFLVEALRRIGQMTEADDYVEQLVPSSKIQGYRNKVELDIQIVGRSVQLGFHGRGTNDFTAVESCRLLPQNLSDAPRKIAGALTYACKEVTPYLHRVGIRVSEVTNDVELSLWTDPCRIPRPMIARVLNEALRTTSLTHVIVGGRAEERKIKQVEVLSGRGYWREKLDGRVMKFSAPSFFQVNSEGAQVLIATVLEFLERAGVGKHEHVADLYAGGGTFTLPLAARYHVVSAVESYKSSIRDLRRNLEDNHLGARVIGGDAARELAAMAPLSAVIVDPPRSGLTAEARGALIAARPYCIVYVSCNPATLARDIKEFLDENYLLRTIRPIDLFPQTYHVESVALLVLGDEPRR